MLVAQYWSQVLLPITVASYLFVTTAAAQQEEDPAAKVTFSPDVPINRLALIDLLKIKSISGTFELLEGANSCQLRLDFYRQGKLIPVQATNPGVGGAQRRRHGQFSVQIVDLDHLRLGRGPAGHWHFMVKLLTSEEPDGRGVVSTTEFQVDKAQFDAQPRQGRTGLFTLNRAAPAGKSATTDSRAGRATVEIPLFWSASGRVRPATNRTDLLTDNPESDILVGVLVIQRNAAR